MTDFTKLLNLEIAKYLVENQSELDASGLEEVEVIEKLTSGKAVLELRTFGFALIELKPGYVGLIPHLWVFFIASEYRGKGFGTSIHAKSIKEILSG